MSTEDITIICKAAEATVFLVCLAWVANTALRVFWGD